MQNNNAAMEVVEKQDTDAGNTIIAVSPSARGTVVGLQTVKVSDPHEEKEQKNKNNSATKYPLNRLRNATRRKMIDRRGGMA